MSKKKKTTLSVIALMLAWLFIIGEAGYTLGGKSLTSGERFRIRQLIPGASEKLEANTTAPEIELKPAPENLDDGYETTEIYEKVIPSVVCIDVYSGTSISASSQGTGIVMTENGYIITNAHVVSGGTSVNVVFEDGTKLRGTIVGADNSTDIAVIKVDAKGLIPAEFGDSDNLKIGERCVAIGNAGGLSGSITTGVVSGLNREVDSSARAFSLIQTSRAINPGNSGGPLVNRFGQVIGITSSKIASVSYEGIGFAIPITLAMPVISELIENGYVTGRAVLGISVIELNSSNGPENDLPSYGAYIARINEGSRIEEAGIRERDVIIEANGVKVETTQVLLDELEKLSPGDTINLGIFRPETEETFYADVVLIESRD